MSIVISLKIFKSLFNVTDDDLRRIEFFPKKRVLAERNVKIMKLAKNGNSFKFWRTSF